MSELINRQAIKEADKWDLSVVFKNYQKWNKALNREAKRLLVIDVFVGKLDTVLVIKDCFDLVTDIDQPHVAPWHNFLTLPPGLQRYWQ